MQRESLLSLRAASLRLMILLKDKNFDHDKAERTRGSMQEAEDKKTKGSQVLKTPVTVK